MDDIGGPLLAITALYLLPGIVLGAIAWSTDGKAKSVAWNVRNSATLIFAWPLFLIAVLIFDESDD